MNRFPAKTLAISLLLIIGLGIFAIRTTAYVVDARELAVILQFGKPVKSIDQPGLYFKVPFVQKVRRFPRTLQLWTSDEEIVDLPTADGKKVEVMAWAVWRIKDPLKFIQALRTVENGQLAVKDRVRAAIRDEITRHDLAEVVRSSGRELSYTFQFVLPDIGDFSRPQAPENATPAQPGANQTIQLGREKIIEDIKLSVRSRLEGTEEGEIDRGVELVDVDISNIGFVPTVREAAFERLKAFMDSIASGYTSAGEQRKLEIINRTRAEVEEILGNGERQSNIIRGRADARIIDDYALAITETGDLYTFLKQLEVYEKSLGDGTRLILTTDSELFQLLNKIQPASRSPQTTGVPNTDDRPVNPAAGINGRQ